MLVSQQLPTFPCSDLVTDGVELPGAPGYKYYGAAKNLPGVRELFAEIEEAAEKKRLQRTRGEMRWNLSADYYGFDGDDEPIILQKEKEREVWSYFIVLDEAKSGGAYSTICRRT